MAHELCPFCKNTVNEGADVCHSCGAQKGYDGAGRSKHFIGWIGLSLAALGYFGFSTGDKLLSLFSILPSFIAFAMIAGWLINLVTPAKWHRAQYGNFW